MKTKFDFIIVGQGLAGTVLAHFLAEKGKSVFVIDKYNSSSSSNIAAGIIHPITGRRLVKSWMFDDAWPFARNTYLSLEKKFSDSFFKEISILEICTSVKNRNDWIERSGDWGYKNLIADELPANFDPAVNCPYGAIKLFPTGYLMIKKLVAVYRKFLVENNQMLEENFEFENLILTDDKVLYKNYEADKIIFCEGYHAQHSPFFKQLPYQFAKGEVIKLRCDSLREDYIINKSIYIQPLGEHLFRVGSTYNWNQLNDEPTTAAKENLTKQFSSIVALPFTIENHEAAVRPTMKSRRPAIGLHHINSNVGIFNGLGTKGVLLAPYLSHHFGEHLINGTSLMKEVEIEKVDN